MINVKENLDLIYNFQVKLLANLFKGNEWAINYINIHKYRCYDDLINIQLYKSHANVLNVGGAPYLFEALALKSNQLHKVTTIDLEPERHLQVIKLLNLDVKKVDIEDVEQRKDLILHDFDVILLCEVLEHMRIDLIGTLKFLREGMRDDAILYLTTPNFYSFCTFARTLLGLRSGPNLVSEWGKLERLGHMGHIREYSKRELVELFEYVGFKVESCKHRNSRRYRITKSLQIFPITICKLFERSFDLFAQEFVFVLRK